MHSTPARIRCLAACPAGLVAVALAVACAWPLPAARAQGFANGAQDALGPHYRESPDAQREQRRPPRDRSLRGMVRHWNEMAIDASGLDHTPVASGEPRVYGEQLGPARASRAMAIVHIAVFEAVNAVMRRHQSYVGLPPAAPGTSLEAAIAQAAHDTLVALFPSQRAAFDAQLAQDLAAVRSPRAKDLGTALGQRAAGAILALRANDGSAHAEPRIGVDYLPSPGPGTGARIR